MKTIKEISLLCNVSKTTVNRVIKELNLEPTVYKNRHLFDDGQVSDIMKHINETDRKPHQENETKKAFFDTETKTTQQNEPGQENATGKEESIELQMLHTLQEQLKFKDEQIKDLSEKLDKQIELNQFKSQQIAMLTAPRETETETKPHWWEKWFK